VDGEHPIRHLGPKNLSRTGGLEYYLVYGRPNQIPNIVGKTQNSFWDCYGTFDDQGLFSVKFARFRNFFDFAQIWGILESEKLWEIQCWRVADGKDESW